MSLSLCMIVKDEALNLPCCLQSVQDVVDEMIVVDTGSRDQTIEIARQYGATVHERPWHNDFAAARNESISLATGDWILVLDADEVLMPESIKTLKDSTRSPDLIAVTLLRQELGAQQTPYTLLSRLFRRHPQLCFERPYHESIDDSVSTLILQEPHWKVGSILTPVIAHTGYQPEAIASRQKWSRAAQIMGQYLATHPADAYICSKLGGLYLSQGRTEEALTLLQQGLHQHPADVAVLYELHFHLGLVYKKSGELALARQHYETALNLDLPNVLKLATFINLAALYIDLGEFPQAESLLLKALQIQPDWALAYYNLGSVHKAVGQFPNAINAYQQAIQLQPDFAEAHQNLGVTLFKLGQIPEGLDAFRRAISLYQHTNPAEAAHLQQRLQALGWQP